MALDIIKLGKGAPKVSGLKHTVKERMFRTADGDRAVPEGHPDAAFVLFAPGEVIPLEDAKKHGLVNDEPAPKPEPKQAPRSRDKSRKAPASDKAAAAQSDKDKE